MKLKEYIENLNQLVKEHPEALEYQVIYSEDSEGNGYGNVYFGPTLGYWDDEDTFIPEDDFEIEHVNYDEPLQSNVVCIN